MFLLLLCFFCTGFLHNDGSSSFHPTPLKPEGGADPQLIDKCQQELLTIKHSQDLKESLKIPTAEQSLEFPSPAKCHSSRNKNADAKILWKTLEN